MHDAGAARRYRLAVLIDHLRRTTVDMDVVLDEQIQGRLLENVVERWIGNIDYEIRENGGGTEADVKQEFGKQLRPLQDLVSGLTL